MFHSFDEVDPHSPNDQFFNISTRSRHTDADCPFCDDGTIQITSGGYTCDTCDCILGEQHIDSETEELTYERYENSEKWRMRGAYDPHTWEGAYSFENLSDEDDLLSRR